MRVTRRTSDLSRRRGKTDRLGRRLVQLGFLLLFLYPFAPIIYVRLTAQPAPVLASWLLPWDPLLMLGAIARRNWVALVIGGPLLLMALSFLLGRSFCGWVCPLGTTLDLISGLAFWRWRQTRRGRRLATYRGRRFFAPDANSRLRYYLLIAALAAGMLSLQALGVLDPLVIFHRMATILTTDFFQVRQPALAAFFSAVSLVFLAIVLAELWQPRFWCRNLCPLGALLSLPARWSLLNRRVGAACNRCGECRRVCSMNAIPKEPHNTGYSDCTMCLECERVCPKAGISFGFGLLASHEWQRDPVGEKQPATPAADQTLAVAPAPVDASPAGRRSGRYVAKPGGVLAAGPSRRDFVRGLASAAVGLAIVPVVNLDQRRAVIRPPGALAEEEFVRTCILCQECVRVCPNQGLRPTLLEAGIAAAGTPHLVPRAGTCTLNPSCPHLCAQACPVGAIRPINPTEMKLGLAQVNRPTCLAWDQGAKCLVCVEACLADAAQMYDGRIVVDPARCTGCGRCENVCPVAGGAIHVEPLPGG